MPILAVWSLLGLEIFTTGVCTTIALVGGSMYYQRQQAKSAESKARSRQEGTAIAQAEIAGRQRAIQQAPIKAEQMKLVMGAEEIGSLLDEFYEQDQAETEVYYLPTAEPTSPVERINRAISDFFRK